MRLLLAGCVISVLLELFVLGRKEKFGDGWFSFYALLGFVSCTLMIFAAKGLGLWLKVPTDFYEEKTGESTKNLLREKMQRRRLVRFLRRRKEKQMTAHPALLLLEHF